MRGMAVAQYSDYAAGWEIEESGFDSRQNIYFFLVPTVWAFSGAHIHTSTQLTDLCV
jgi:hypothetical protein